MTEIQPSQPASRGPKTETVSQTQIFLSLGRFSRVISHSNGKLTGTARINFGVRYARLAETLVEGFSLAGGGGGWHFQCKIGKGHLMYPGPLPTYMRQGSLFLPL